jgi:hypothetical protein
MTIIEWMDSKKGYLELTSFLDFVLNKEFNIFLIHSENRVVITL